MESNKASFGDKGTPGVIKLAKQGSNNGPERTKTDFNSDDEIDYSQYSSKSRRRRPSFADLGYSTTLKIESKETDSLDTDDSN